MADIPSGTGLGSSGSFTVGLLQAIYAMKRDHVAQVSWPGGLCHRDRATGPAGGEAGPVCGRFRWPQDHHFEPDGQVRCLPADSTDTLHDLEEHLLMFFTGYSRAADKVLEEQRASSDRGDPAMIDNLHYVKKLGLQTQSALENGDARASRC